MKKLWHVTNKIKYPIFAALVLLGASKCLAWPWSSSFDLPYIAKKASPSVVKVVVADAAGHEVATGTGFFISDDGMLITNLHVVENSESAVAKLADGRVLPVMGVLADGYTTSDLVLLKTTGNDLPALKLGNSFAQKNEWVSSGSGSFASV